MFNFDTYYNSFSEDDWPIHNTMTRDQEIRHFARFYSIRLAVARELFAKYSRKPAVYRELMAVESDAKTTKGSKYGYLTGIIYLAPGNLSGHEVCASRTNACFNSCLGFEGRARLFETVLESRISKTNLLFESPEVFHASMLHDAFRLLRTTVKRRMKPAFRPNGTSDLPKLAWIIAEAFPFLQVYDYTKHPRPWTRTRSNYHLTFSYSGANWADCVEALNHGVNVTVVFSDYLPATFRGYEVVNGDDTDLRFLDKTGVIIGLKAKGVSADKETTGTFIIDQRSPFQILAA